MTKQPPKTFRSRPTIQSLSRGLRLLDYVVSADRPVRLGELAELMDIQKSSAHRLMATLVAYGYVVQDSQSRYVPGPAIMELASKIGNRMQVHQIAGPFLNDLAEKTGETAHLAVLGNGQVILTNCVPSNHTLAVRGRVGAAEPLHCTALGKAVICQMEDSSLKAILGRGRLKKYTDHTIVSVSSLIRECHRIKATWLAKDDEEFRPGIRCLAAPVKNFAGNVVAAIGISGPVSRLNDQRFEQMGIRVRNTGIELSKKLGFVFKGDNGE